MKKKILILGGTMFVGRLLVEALIKEDVYEVHLFNRGKTRPHLFPELNKIVGDRESDDIQKIKDYEWDYVVDFSSFYPASLEATINSLNKTVKQYIYISSLSAYNLNDFDGEILENHPLAEYTEEEKIDTTMKTYGKRKAACEEVLNKASWLNTVILRPSIIYGTYDWTSRFYYWMYRLKHEHEILVPDSGDQIISLTYASDVVNLIIKCFNSDIKKGAYNCSTHPPLPFKEMLHKMASVLNVDCRLHGVPQDWLLENEVKKQFDIPLWFGKNIIINNSKLINEFGIDLITLEDSFKENIQFCELIKWKAPSPRAGMSLEKEQGLIEQYQASIKQI